MLNALDTETEAMAGRKRLEGLTAIVTGSTSGIGLGIAHAFARAGAAVMLNGFGNPAEIEMLRAEMASDNDVDVAYDPADGRPTARGELSHRTVSAISSGSRTRSTRWRSARGPTSSSP